MDTEGWLRRVRSSFGLRGGLLGLPSDLAKIEVSCRVKYVTGQVRRSGHPAKSVEAVEQFPSLKVARLDKLHVAVWPAAKPADVHPS
jgi:hypothetical protein